MGKPVDLSSEEKHELTFKLRDITGAAAMDCKQCLIAYSWDIETARQNWDTWYKEHTRFIL